MCTAIKRLAAVTIYGILLSGCIPTGKPVSPFAMTNELVVITVAHTDNFYIDSEGHYSGITYDLVNEFAAEIGLEIRFIIMLEVESALAALHRHQAHLAIGLDIPEHQTSRFILGPVYLHTHHQIAFNASRSEPKDIQQLVGKHVKVPAGSTHENQLQRMKTEIPDLTWSAVPQSSETLLAKLDKGKIDYTVADSLHIKKANHFYPKVRGAFELDVSVSRWIFPKYTEKLLIDRVSEFFERIEQEGVLGQLLDSYNGPYHQLSPGDIYFFKNKIHSRLPELKPYFFQAARITGIDWRLLAALAYQESHWNPKAKSPTGVSGIMMLTRETARRMGIKNLTDSRLNILAGARYLKLLKEKLPESVSEPDRTWMALAAYNQGYGRIIDARALAKRFNLNPDLWIDLKKMLPLLNKQHYAEEIKYGHARGDEAVTLTNSVRAYYEILKRVTP
ncbi:MAG: membrane-bound lytic murein transglycosylase MltF [Burkholderiales bacterium]|uniref:membrane-bound lytic murein transglycosylase MltF n=1 Tax=Nitrosomonas sp. TaxID=42353 RepID=UPI001D70D8EF|nr:membrane-bound lytic murein transglycosylase MltF [Nitrosomonas sp.]MCB1948560.1 membrane-bound lytic murein transglycosylase MltF [Nitrosomonas sp.]MCP5243453.1 membrane-bound lytic murein transglycosylase MltF [Burkholderiales bacterium]